MNIVLDSPLEALVFNYVNFGSFALVNNLWAWVGLITAAVSLWRIRAAVNSQPLTSINCISRQVDESGPVFEKFSEPTTQPSPPSPSPSYSVSVPAVSGSSGFPGNGVTKSKFVVYYEDDDVESESNDDGDHDGDRDNSEIPVIGESNGKEWSECWERVLRMKMGDLGWYRYQDLTAINGNVVRLWDGDRRNYSSSCVVWRG